MLAIRKYCLVRDNEDLRELIRHKMTQKKLTISELARKLQLNKGNISLYLNGKDSKRLTQYSLVLIAREVGIEISLKFTIND